MLTDDELLAGYYGPSLPRPRPAQVVALLTHLRAVERAVLLRAAADFAARRFFVAQDGFLVETEPTFTVNDIATWLLEQAGGEDGKNTD